MDVRFGFVSYRDHPPQDSSYVVQHTDLDAAWTAGHSALMSANAAGGGDGPEAVATAMDAVLNKFSWRPEVCWQLARLAAYLWSAAFDQDTPGRR